MIRKSENLKKSCNENIDLKTNFPEHPLNLLLKNVISWVCWFRKYDVR